MKGKLLSLIFLLALVSVPLRAQEVPCNLPTQWECSSKMSTVVRWDGWIPHIVECCVGSTQANACNTNGEDYYCNPETISLPQ